MLRLLSAVVVLAFFAAVGAVVGAAPVFACSCEHASEGTHLNRADVVFAGRVIDRGAPGA